MNSLKSYMNKRRAYRGLIFLSVIFTLFFTGVLVRFDLIKLIEGLPHMGDLLGRILSPNLSYAFEIMGAFLETMEIAVLASLAGVIISVPMAMLVSKNASPSRVLSSLLSVILAIFRTIPSLVWAAFLVSMFSVGKFSGIIASFIIASLIGTRLFREEIDSISDERLSAIKSTGATDIQVLKYAIIPSIRTNMVSVYFIILESCMRGAAVLGLVGAGGIGQIMWKDINTFRYDKVATVILMMFLLIYLFDYLSVFVRSRIDTRTIKVGSIGGYRKRKFVLRIIKPIFFVTVIYGIVRTLGIDSERFAMGMNQGKYILENLLKMDFTYFDRMLQGLSESLAIAIFATICGSFFAFLLVGVSAKNLSRSTVLSWILKAIANVLRTFPPIVGAIMFFRGVGPGPFAGALALTMYTTGVLTKLYLESVESMSANVAESLIVTGAKNSQIYVKGIFPESAATFFSLALYRMESNIRNATVLGLVGAGGIGTLLSANIQWRNWNRVGLLLLGSGIMIICFDTLSRVLRKKLAG